MRDAIAAWNQGIPAVVLVHEPFATMAKVQCETLGAKDQSIIVYKQDAPAFESDEMCDQKAQSVARQILEMLGA